MNFPSFTITDYTVGRGSLAVIKDQTDGKIGLVVDSNILKALDLERVLFDTLLKGRDYRILCDIRQEPTTGLLADPIVATREYAPQEIIAIGGGSVMDAAKALWLFYELPEYDWERAFVPYQIPSFPGKARLTVIPTTSGTGSETTGCSVVKNDKNDKCMILSNEIIPTRALLDFDLLTSLPGKVVAFSGTDALAHALEASVSSLSSTLVSRMGLQAAVTLIRELPRSFRGDQGAREKVHIAATMAGAAIGNSITGMAHGMDFAGGDFHLPHGMLTGMLLPYTMRYLIPQPFYCELADQLGILDGDDDSKQKTLIGMIWDLYDELEMPKTLGEAGVPEDAYLEKIPSYVERAKKDANILCCPKQPGEEELTALFRQFYYGLKDGEL